ncbi:hypothetical protein [Dictyobacter aurantiacus]|uniref:Type II secretion system protein GspE N-terminal domain-containing protein n=1 Tax=Dictyobacter aurantiacus TaxID=1936993 RepID=A0A401ZFJ8_9CHLR|nr:hypothetical protein [Dictyobacter aurantiacus]GCE05645.1 hypothetical protein KDAU_29740 [Dictyobacter aurantiacus]
MCKKALSLPAFSSIDYAVTPINSVQDVTTAMQRLIAEGVSSLALVTLPLHFDFREGAGNAGDTSIQQSMQYYAERLRRLVRKTDQVFLHKTTLYILLLGANLHGAGIVQERLWEELLWRVHNAPEIGIMRPSVMAIGHSAYPLPDTDIHGCIAAAHTHHLIFEVQSIQSQNASTETEEIARQARQLGVPYLSLLPRKVPTRLQQVIPPQLAQELHCYPVGRERNTLTVAMTNPHDSQVLARLQQITGLRIFPVIVPPQELQTALAQFI